MTPETLSACVDAVMDAAKRELIKSGALASIVMVVRPDGSDSVLTLTDIDKSLWPETSRCG